MREREENFSGSAGKRGGYIGTDIYKYKINEEKKERRKGEYKMASERRPEKPPARHRSGRSSLCVYARSFRLSSLIGRRHKRRPSPPACTTTTHHHHPKNLKPFRPSFPILDWTPDNIGTAAQLSGVLLRAFGASPSIYIHIHTHRHTDNYHPESLLLSFF